MVGQVKLAVIPGDGIGPEVIAEALKVLEAATAGSDVAVRARRELLARRRPLPRDRRRAHRRRPRRDSRSTTRSCSARSAATRGDPRLAGGIIERGLLLQAALRARPLREPAADARSSRASPVPLADPGEVDFVVVREGTEGPYVGNGGAHPASAPRTRSPTRSRVNTAFGVERVVRFAFAHGRRRAARSSRSCTRPTCSSTPGGLWQRTSTRSAAEYPDVAVDYLHVDAATIFLVTDPARFDVIVTDNLFGDILTDLAGAISGGIGLAASGNINPDGAFPSMFEPVHGSAPDIAGQQHGRPDRRHPVGGAAARPPRARRRSRDRGRRGRHRRPRRRAATAAQRPPRSATRSPRSLDAH